METKRGSERDSRAERADVGTGQDIETQQGSKENSLPGVCGRRNWSRHGNKARQRGGTHFLEWANTGTGQDMETKRGSDGDSLAEEGRRQESPGRRNKTRK